MSGHALARVRVRSRRRKPRGPKWKRKAVWIMADAMFVCVCFLCSLWLNMAAILIILGFDWRDFHRSPCDPEAAPLSLHEEIVKQRAMWCALLLCLISIFT